MSFQHHTTFGEVLGQLQAARGKAVSSHGTRVAVALLEEETIAAGSEVGGEAGRTDTGSSAPALCLCGIRSRCKPAHACK